MNLLLSFIAVSRSIKPSDVGLLAKPSHLTLRVVSGVTLDYTNRLRLRDRGIDISNYLSIAYRLKCFGGGGSARCQKVSNFIHKSRLHHAANALIDSSIEIFPSWIKTHEQDFETHDRLARLFVQML